MVLMLFFHVNMYDWLQCNFETFKKLRNWESTLEQGKQTGHYYISLKKTKAITALKSFPDSVFLDTYCPVSHVFSVFLWILNPHPIPLIQKIAYDVYSFFWFYFFGCEHMVIIHSVFWMAMCIAFDLLLSGPILWWVTSFICHFTDMESSYSKCICDFSTIQSNFK